MAFVLSMGRIKDMVSSEQDEAGLRDLLAKNNIPFNENFDPQHFSSVIFEEIADSEETYEVETYTHWELHWSSWIEVQLHLLEILGEPNVRTAVDIHAWYGVAVPGDLENTMVGEPVRYQWPAPKPSFLEKIGLKKPGMQSRIQSQVDKMRESYGGPYENLMVVSGTRLLAELDAAIEKKGYDPANLEALSEAYLEDDGSGAAEFCLLTFREFLHTAMTHQHLAWFIK